MRISVATAGNDHRLGANEAPPAIISIFLGDELTAILDAIENGKDYEEIGKQIMEVGVHVLPNIPKDTTDRNRTSPFAFTGNKFEFRMLGSSSSISGPNTTINTIVAEQLEKFADELEKADNFKVALNELIVRNIKAHKRIIFNGDGYSDQWKEEAKNRGLLNLTSTVDALPHFLDKKNIDLFSKHNIYTEKEIHSRYDVSLETYSKHIRIEALTLINMLKTDILPAISSYVGELSKNADFTLKVLPNCQLIMEKETITKLCNLKDEIYKLKNLTNFSYYDDSRSDKGETSK